MGGDTWQPRSPSLARVGPNMKKGGRRGVVTFGEVLVVKFGYERGRLIVFGQQ